MKHFPSVEGYTAVISRVIVKQTTSDCCNERLIHTYLDVLWCAIPTLVVCIASVLATLDVLPPKNGDSGKGGGTEAHTSPHWMHVYH